MSGQYMQIDGRYQWVGDKSLYELDHLEDVRFPVHYGVLDGLEAIEIIASSLSLSEFRGYCLGNILKYRLRAGKKDDLRKDIKKADEYVLLFDEYKHLCKAE